MRHILVPALALALAVPFAAAKDGKKAPKDPGKGVNFYSVEKEIALGRQMALEVEREARLLQDPKISEYVNRLGQTLALNSDPKTPFTVKVIDSDDVNAFALPGGYMYVNTGLLLEAGNEAEFAGVLAHEIAHVAARHGAKQATRGQLVDYATIPLIFWGGWAGFAVRQAAELAIPLGFLEFSRGMEAQADRLGLQYMDRAGYDPVAFIDFFERVASLEKKKPSAIARVFSSHPMTGSRIRDAQKQIQNEFQARPEYVLDTSEYQDVRQRLRDIQNRRNSGTWMRIGPVLMRRGSSISLEP